MRPVKPRFLIVQRRVVVFVEDVIEALLSPADKWPLAYPLKRHAPNGEARLAVGERDRSNALKDVVVLYETGVACEIEASGKNEDEGERAGGIAAGAPARGDRSEERRECQPEREPYDCAACFGIEEKYRLYNRKCDKRPLQP